MMSGLSILFLATAQAAAPAEAAVAPKPAAEACSPSDPTVTGEAQEIVICVERPEGYRIDPDVMEAERQAKRKKLKRPERYADTSCQSVGPMGCTQAGVNLLAAAVTAATMAKRAVEGGNVGEMFITEPEPDEYGFYREAKRKREAEKAARAAEAELIPAE